MKTSMKFPYSVVDLTHVMDEAIPTLDGECGFQHHIQSDYAACSGEVKFRTGQFKTCAGIGTHLDAPAHCLPGGMTVDQIPVSHLLAPCILPGMKQYNLTPVINQQTSYMRLNQINELMQKNISSLDFDQFIAFSFNAEASNDHPLAEFDKGYADTYQDNSIFRTFNSRPDRRDPQAPASDQGVSTMIVELLRNTQAPMNLYLRIINHIQDSKDAVFTQHIDYTEAKTSLDTAINSAGAITYLKKSCQRNINSKSCR